MSLSKTILTFLRDSGSVLVGVDYFEQHSEHVTLETTGMASGDDEPTIVLSPITITDSGKAKIAAHLAKARLGLPEKTS